MLTTVHPKLPMRSREVTIQYYTSRLGFRLDADYGDYLILSRDAVEIHFFFFPGLDPAENYGQVYIRTNQIDGLYSALINNQTPIHPNGHLQVKPWGQKEFSLLDPDHNLLTFGQSVD